MDLGSNIEGQNIDAKIFGKNILTFCIFSNKEITNFLCNDDFLVI